MKKILLTVMALVIALGTAFFVSKGPKDSIADGLDRLIPKKNTKKVVSVLLNDATADILAKNEKKLDKKQLEKNVQSILNCIDDESCLSSHERFNDGKLDPAFSQLVEKLEVLEQQNSLDLLSDDQLIKMASFKNPALFYKSSALLLEKSQLNLKELSKIEFTGEEVKLHLSLFRSGQSELNPELIQLRDESIQNYFLQDNYTFLHALKEMQHLSFEIREVEDLSQRACERLSQIESFKNIYRKQINMLARKYTFKPSC